MDQIFDRFERLFKSWVAGTARKFGRKPESQVGRSRFRSRDGRARRFLNTDRTATEERERQKARREAEDRARRERESRAHGSSGSAPGRVDPAGPNPKLVAAYRTLGLEYGVPFDRVKSTYKKLLMKNHPDRNSATPEQMKRSTEISAQLNAAYQRIETWATTGVVPED